jgi:hypothetical protein
VRWFPDRRGPAAAGYGFGAFFTASPSTNMTKCSGHERTSLVRGIRPRLALLRLWGLRVSPDGSAGFDPEVQLQISPDAPKEMLQSPMSDLHLS